MTVGLIAIALIVAFTGLWCFAVRHTPDDVMGGLFFGGLALAFVLGAWALIAWPWSSYQKDICQQKAEGYGLDESQWSFRHDCRVYLPTGQLVPESRIRITSDGQIVVVDD